MTINSTSEPRSYTAEEIQDELIDHLTEMCHYWVQENRRGNLPDAPNYYLEGLLHSTYVTFAGNSGGFDTSLDIYPYVSIEQQEKDFGAGKNSFPVFDECTDINDGSLQYFTYQGYPKEKTVANIEAEPRVWDEKEMRDLFHHEIFRILDKSVAGASDELEAAGSLMRGLLDLFENGTDNFPKCNLVSRSHDEDIEYFKSNGENFYVSGTVISGRTPSLVEKWDAKWKK